MNNNLNNARLLPFTVIQKAAGGDVEAINTVLKHYAGYIAKLSLRELYDEYGNPHEIVLKNLREAIQYVSQHEAEFMQEAADISMRDRDAEFARKRDTLAKADKCTPNSGKRTSVYIPTCR